MKFFFVVRPLDAQTCGDSKMVKKAHLITHLGAAGMLALSLTACGPRVVQDADPAALIGEAWTAYRLSEFQNAALAFDAARNAAIPGSDEWAMATYGLGTTWDLRRPGEDPRKATALYQEILGTAPQSPIIPWTELALARQKHLVPVGQEPDYDAVNKAYQHIIDQFPGHLAAKEAFLYLQSIQLAKLEPVSTQAAVEKLLDFVAHEKKEFLSPAWSLLAVAYTTLGDQEKRLEAEINSFETTEVDPSDPFIEFAWAYWNLATIAEFEVGDFDLARHYYNLLLEKYPTDIRVYGCKQALRRMDALEASIRAEEEAPQP
jgi:tetratricopeptide (TPR) repeat protein